MFDFTELVNSVMKGDDDRAVALTRQAMEAHIPAREILDKGLVRAMDTVGNQFARGEVFFPELLISGDTMKAALELLKPEFTQGRSAYLGKCAIGTVRGDVHDIGKNIVIMMLEGNGWEVTDLGIDVSPEDFCSAMEKDDYHIVGMSALLTLTMSNLARTMDILKTAGLRNRVKIMVGGAPVTQAYADQIGADGYAPDAAEAVKVATRLLEKS